RFAGMDVGDVDFDDRRLRVGEGIADRVAVVGEGASVDDDAGAFRGMILDEVDDRALMIGLERLNRNCWSAMRRLLAEPVNDGLEGRGSVLLGFSGAELVEIWTVDYENARCGRIRSHGTLHTGSDDRYANSRSRFPISGPGARAAN